MTGEDLPSGSEGELAARGPIVTAGYYDKPDETAAVTLDGGWLRSGDLGCIDEGGYLRLTGRSKDLYKCGGELVMPTEVEARLTARSDVAQAHIVGVPDERWQERPLAVVVLNEGASVTAADLRKFLADKVVRWWLPERWAFADEIPRTSVGKYDKKAIRSRYADDGYDVTEVRD